MKQKFILLLGIIFGVLLVLIVWFYRSSEKDLANSPLAPSDFALRNEPLEFAAWISWYDEERGLKSLSFARETLSVVSPVRYELMVNGVIKELASSKKEELNDLVSKMGLKVLPTIGNALEGKRVSEFLKDEQAQEREIGKLVDLALAEGFWGLDFDFEEIYLEDREKFTDLVTKLARRLHEQQLILSVTVHAQTGTDEDWTGALGQNWEAIAKEVDFVRIMAYDFHNSQTGPGPVTPLDDLEKILAYAVSTIPREKIVLALPTYGYDWGDRSAESLQYEDIIQRLSDHKGTSRRDRESYALVGEYSYQGVKHTVWFEDKESIIKKVLLGRTYGVNKFCFWYLGGEDRTLWNALLKIP